jgi:hypothetical protein
MKEPIFAPHDGAPAQQTRAGPWPRLAFQEFRINIMHPPFFMVDHKINHDVSPTGMRPVIRRSRPEKLRLDLPAPGLPMVVYAPVHRRRGRQGGPSVLARLLRAIMDRVRPARQPLKDQT